MPPKRKRAAAADAEAGSTADGTAASAPATAPRRSGRKAATKASPTEVVDQAEPPAKTPAKKNGSAKAKTTKPKKSKKDVESEDEEQTGQGVATEPPAKKAKTTKAAQSKAKSTKSNKSGQVGSNDDDAGPSNLPSRPPASTVNKSKDKTEPYTPERALALFQQYADADNPDNIGAEGFERLCTDAQVPLDGALPMVLSWQLDCQEMLNISKEEWVRGMGSLRISSLTALYTALVDLERLLILRKPPLKKPSAAGKKRAAGDADPYDRSLYWSYASDVKKAFHKLYMYCFNLAKPQQSRNIDMETAVAFWTLLLAPKHPIMSEIVQYINENGSYKAANKDLWSMMLEFCETVDENLKGYDSEEAWPTLVDGFVAWKREKVGGSGSGAKDAQ